MKKYRYLNISEFKAGDIIWLSGVCFLPSGRLSYILRPTQRRISEVSGDRVIIGDVGEYGYLPYKVPTHYTLDLPDGIDNVQRNRYAINSNIAGSKEESIENFNQRLREELEEIQSRYQTIERNISRFFM